MAGRTDWAALAKSGGLEKLKVGELKGYLKEKGLSQTGEKGTLMFRIKAHLDGERLKIDGVNPAEMKPAALKKACAQRGLSPMGYPDELLESLIKYLKANPPSGSGGGGGGDGGEASAAAAGKGGGGGDGDGDGEEDEGNAAVALVHRILALSETEAWGAILSLGATGAGGAGPLSRRSPTALLRKAYHRLSLLVHPDKLRGVPEATRAFQAVVTSFERLSSPEEEEEAAGGKGKKGKGAGKEGKAKTIARSNEGCHRTRVFCPRCKEEWGLPIQGLPDYAYNYFMMGLKTYTCSTCLLDFGCLTAIHRCPSCRKTFEYDPHDYHRHVVCGNKGCTRPFGFYCFSVSDRVEKEMREQLKAEQEARLRAREAKIARLARSAKRTAERGAAGGGEEEDLKLKLRMFVGGLLDECPRCGEAPECAPEDREAHRAHLRACKGDAAKARAYQAKREEAEKRAAERAAKQAAQEDLQSLRTWEFLGGKEGDMWLLTDDQLEKQCRDKGLLPAPEAAAEGDGDTKEAPGGAASAKLSKEEMIARLVAHKEGEQQGRRLLTDGTTQGEAAEDEKGPAKKKRKLMTRDSLPGNLHGMSVAQLRAVCAAHGWQPRSESRAGIIKEMEKEVAKAEGHEEIYLLEG